MLQGNRESFDATRFGALVTSALSNRRRQLHAGSVSVSQVTSEAINSTHYKAVVKLNVVGTTAPETTLAEVANKLVEYDGFADNGFVIVGVEHHMEQPAAATTSTSGSASSSTTASPSHAVPEPENKKDTNIVAIVVPVVIGGVVLIAIIVGGVFYYKKKNGGGGGGGRGGFNQSRTPSSDQLKRKKKGQPNIWLDMEALPVPENTAV